MFSTRRWPLVRLVAALQVTRIALVFTAISNIWLIVFLSRALELTGPATRLDLWLVLLCTAAIAAGLYVFGMSLNDLMDMRRDRLFAPNRPLPSGRLSVGAAATIASASLLVAITASIALGIAPTLLTLLTAALILFYNSFAKHLPGVGILTLGLIRGAHMLIANPALGFVWPVWLTLTHVIGLSAAAHRLEHKRPTLAAHDIWTVVGGWAFVTLAITGWMSHRNTLVADGPGWIWVGPVVAVVVFLLPVVLMTLQRAPDERAAGGMLMKRGLLWLIVYDAAWLAGAGLWWECGVILALLAAAMVSMTTMRHLTAATAQLSDYVCDEGGPSALRPSPERRTGL